jgi:hypothetical protein
MYLKTYYCGYQEVAGVEIASRFTDLQQMTSLTLKEGFNG